MIKPNTWYKVVFTKDQLIAGNGTDLSKETEKLLRHAFTDEMAVFCAGIPGTEYYFSPAAAQKAVNIVARYNGEPSEPPPKHSVSLILGSDHAWDLIK